MNTQRNLKPVVNYDVSGSFAERDSRLLGRILVAMGVLSEADLNKSLFHQKRVDAQLGDILIAQDLVSREDLTHALAQQYGLGTTDLDGHAPDPALRSLLPADTCRDYLTVPFNDFGGVLLLATARPDRFEELKAEHIPDGLSVLPVIADAEQIRQWISKLHGAEFVHRAETRAPEHLSCRPFAQRKARRALIPCALICLLICSAVLKSPILMKVLTTLCIVTLFCALGLKLVAGLTQLFSEGWSAAPPSEPDVTPIRLPRVSVMVPLLRERNIAEALIRRLKRLTYPKSVLDIVLVLEESDDTTRWTLAETDLPPWIRVVEVPKGSGLTTKPRALNYALDFCLGDIIGVWDAEDAPALDQVEKVVTRFQNAPPSVVCLQGRLDYYNSRQNWIARCFTIEYAAWWRLVMPGLERLGQVIPLGGTTLFFRRKPLEDLGGWDAHNVTEDADLGLRLARAGYRTELIETATYEEASCRPWRWVRQRSRWLKGFALTWAVHMREPRQLCRDLGILRFLGLQVFFLAALSQFTLAPVFWVFWLGFFGLPTKFSEIAAPHSVAIAFLLCELAALSLHAAAVRRKDHRHLMIWTVAMPIYFAMGCIAMYKALLELIISPFFWDKTDHGDT